MKPLPTLQQIQAADAILEWFQDYFSINHNDPNARESYSAIQRARNALPVDPVEYGDFKIEQDPPEESPDYIKTIREDIRMMNDTMLGKFSRQKGER